MMLRNAGSCLLLCTLLSLSVPPGLASAEESVTMEPPPAAASEAARAPSAEPCPKGKRGGAIGGIVMGSIFWWVLPMSIPVLITQTKKLKAHNRAKLERRCQYAP
jgi:hypothetical protein